MRKTKPIRILAIDPGTKKMGVAVLEDQKLLYHGVYVFKRRRTPQENLHEGSETILQLIRDFRPRLVAMEKTFVTTNRRLALLNVLADEITAIAHRRGLRVLAFAPSTVKKHISGNGHADKVLIAALVAKRYPELKVYLTQDRQWKSLHHANMFDAVAVGLTALARR